MEDAEKLHPPPTHTNRPLGIRPGWFSHVGTRHPVNNGTPVKPGWALPSSVPQLLHHPGAAMWHRLRNYWNSLKCQHRKHTMKTWFPGKQKWTNTKVWGPQRRSSEFCIGFNPNGCSLPSIESKFQLIRSCLRSQQQWRGARSGLGVWCGPFLHGLQTMNGFYISRCLKNLKK